MSSVPLIPESAPFSPEQRAWLNGFFAGVFSRSPAPESSKAKFPGASPAPSLKTLTILFGSQTGTAESLAKKVAKEAGKRGFAPTILDMAQADLGTLAGIQNLLVITSTYGDGEPPDNAKALHAALNAAASAGHGDAAPSPRLSGLRFSICALGDTNYTQFCQCGKDFDLYLAKLGATRATDRVDCDLDYDAKFTAWLEAALAALAAEVNPSVAGGSPAAESQIANLKAHLAESDPPPGFSRSNPFPAVVLNVRNLNASGSAKEVNHVEFSLEGSGLAYEPGDALGVYPQNCPTLVSDILAALGCDGEEAVTAPDGAAVSLRRALTEYYDLGKPSSDLLALAGGALCPDKSGPVSGAPSQLAASPHQVVDTLIAGSAKVSPPAFVATLKKLQPRLYSISSSPAAHPGEVHLTVGAVRYELAGRVRKGACSTFLAERALAAGKVGVFVHRNNAFRPPAPDVPMIMVGPGTGIAPFRAFLQHRRALGAKGRNWLFFGDQRESTDFLYREELQEFQREGYLHRLDLAWSRDQAAKVYVQQRMLEQAHELFAWLESGAHFYVCGDATRMAKDVDAALHRVIELAGRRSPENAAEYVQALRSAKRYQRDVY